MRRSRSKALHPIVTMQPIAEVNEVQDTVEPSDHDLVEPTPTLQAQNRIDSDSEREDVSDDDINIYSMSSMGSGNVGANNTGNNLRRRSPGGTSSARASISASSAGGRHEDNDKTPLVANKRSSRMSYSKQLIKMGRDVFSPPRPRLSMSFLSPSQLTDRKRLLSRRRGGGGANNPDSPVGSIASLVQNDAYQGPTDLHNICHSAQSAELLHSAKFRALPQSTDSNSRTGGEESVARATKVFSIVQREATTKDADGRTAMHILSHNHRLASHSATDEEMDNPNTKPSTNSIGTAALDNTEVASVVDFVVNFLVPANPMALLEEDSAGEIPFENGLMEWMRLVHDEEFGLHRQGGTSTSSFSGVNIENSLQQMQNVVGGVMNQSKVALANVGRSLHISGTMTSSAANPDVTGNVTDGTDDTRPSIAQLQLGQSSSWTIESSSSSDTLSPLAASHDDVEAGTAAGDNGAAPANAPTTGGRKSNSLMSTNNDSFTRRSRTSFPTKGVIRRMPMVLTEKLFPMHGRLSSHAQLTLLILSAIVDRLDEDAKAELRSISIRSNDTGASGLHGTSRAALIRCRLVERIASVPNLIKTLLLLESEEERGCVFEMTIVRAVMLSKRAMGPWFTYMLRSDTRIVSHRAVAYLSLLSNVSSEFNQQQLSHRGRAHLAYKPDEVRKAVLGLDDFVPSLVGLDEAAIEQAATTPIVQKVLDTMITRPFAVSVIFFDCLFLLCLIFSFRKCADGFVEGESPVTVIKWIYVANANIFYFIIRELGKAISLSLISARGFWSKFVWGFWNVVDVFSILFSLASTIFLRVQFSEDFSLGEESRAIRWCLSVATGLLWLRALGFLKTVNMQLATFVLATVQITKDLAWFLLILFAVVASFSQMFYTLLLPPECADGAGTTPNTNIETLSVCQPSEYYLAVYSILLGDYGQFDREDFHTPFSVFLIVLFSFMVVIVLLNVLIAIVSDSYEKCLIRSQFLFGRARVMILAELISFQNLLQKDRNQIKCDDSDRNTFRKLWMRQRSRGWSKGSLIFFALSLATLLIWIIGEMLGFAAGEDHGTIAFSLGSILVNVGVLVIMLTFLSQCTSGMTGASSDNDNSGSCTSCWYRNSIQKCMVRLLGTSEGSSFDKDQDSSTWRGRAVYIQREMTRITTESKTQIKAETKALEGQIYAEMGALERRVLESEVAVTSAISESERRIEMILRDVVLALGEKGEIAKDSTLLRASV